MADKEEQNENKETKDVAKLLNASKDLENIAERSAGRLPSNIQTEELIEVYYNEIANSFNTLPVAFEARALATIREFIVNSTSGYENICALTSAALKTKAFQILSKEEPNYDKLTEIVKGIIEEAKDEISAEDLAKSIVSKLKSKRVFNTGSPNQTELMWADKLLKFAESEIRTADLTKEKKRIGYYDYGKIFENAAIIDSIIAEVILGYINSGELDKKIGDRLFDDIKIAFADTFNVGRV